MDKRSFYVKKFHLKCGREVSFLSAEEIAELTGVQLSTAYRWMRAGKIPCPYRELLEIKVLGSVPGMHGIQVKDEELITANGYHLNRSQLEHYGMMLSNLTPVLRENQRLQADNRRLKKWVSDKTPIKAPVAAPDPRADWFRFDGYRAQAG